MRVVLLFLLPIAIGFIGYFLLARDPAYIAPTLSTITTLPVLGGDEPIRVLFTGDMMLDRTVAVHAAEYGDDSLTKGMQDLFAGMDAIVVNLEGTITTNPSVAVVNHDDLRFTFDPHFVGFLTKNHITAVSLSNNHTDDFGADGYAQTKQYLDTAKIAHFGSPANDQDLSTRVEMGNKSLCFVGYEGFINIDPALIAAEVARIRPECDYLVATMHAGEEYQPTASLLQQNAAHAFIDAGADAVIGTHPHVIEPLEVYKGKPIFYSLGNFIFDQDFSFATRHGLTVEVSLDAHGTSYRLVPITIDHGEASVTTEAADITRMYTPITSAPLPPAVASAMVQGQSFTL